MILLTEYLAAVQARVDRETHSLATGAAQSFEDYKRKTGFIAGLTTATQILQDIVNNKPLEERI